MKQQAGSRARHGPHAGWNARNGSPAGPVPAGAPCAQSPAIEVEDLVKVYPGGRTALDGVSFTVGQGEMFGFLGPNGSGKTTTIKILVTLLGKTSGLARVSGFDTAGQPSRVREVIGYSGQFIGIDDDLTVQENLAISGMLHRLCHGAAWDRAAELASVFALTGVAGVRAGRLSGGMRRRLDLAAALMHRPPVLFLDEPTTGMDPQSRNAVWEHLRGLGQEGTTVFLTTQYLEEADRTCDRVAILDAGRLVRTGTPAALKDEVGEGRLVLRIGSPGDRARAVAALAAFPGAARVGDGGPGDPLVVYVRDPAASLPPVLRLLDAEGIAVIAAEQAQASLDDVFLRYTGRRPRDEAPSARAVSGIFAAAHGRRRPGGAS
jgi:ABC-2 type transport system ATP-binding protein